MVRKQWFHLGIGLILILALGNVFLLTHQAQAQKNAPQPPTLAASTLGTAFTYQGRLTDGGSPASGTYDFQFDLYDDATSGSQVGSASTQSDIAVSNGLFTVTLDFGDVFDGTALWLKISVRPGSSTGAYTALTPRQALTAAPYALNLRPGATIQHNASGYALGITGGNWDPNSMDGDVLVGDATYRFKIAVATNGGGAGDVRLRAQGGTDRMMLGGGTTDMLAVTSSNVGIGTIFPNVTSTLHVETGGERAVYGQNTAVSGTAYGVYGETASTNGTAVYGYANATSGAGLGVLGRTDSPDGNGVSGVANAATGSAIGTYGRSDADAGYGVYGKNNSPTGYGVYSDGNAHVAGQLTWQPITGRVAIPSASFRSESSSAAYSSSAGWLHNDTASSQNFSAGIQLPDGAVVTKLTFYWSDTSASDGSVLLVRNTFDLSASGMATASTSGAAGNGSSSDTTIFDATIDNAQYAYLLRATLPANTSVYLEGVVVEYTIDRPY